MKKYLKPIIAAPTKPATIEELKTITDGRRVSDDSDKQYPKRYEDLKGGKKSD